MMEFRSKEQDAFIADFIELCKRHKVTLSVYDDYNGVDEFCGTKVQIISEEFVNGTAPIFIDDCDWDEFSCDVNRAKRSNDNAKSISESGIDAVFITSPKDMSFNKGDAKQAAKLFEHEFRQESRGLSRYELVVIGQYSRDVCDIMEYRYLSGGWSSAVCKTSSELGDVGNYTSLVLCV